MVQDVLYLVLIDEIIPDCKLVGSCFGLGGVFSTTGHLYT